MVNFIFCASCALYVSNDEIDDLPIEKETAMFSGIAQIRAAYYLSADKSPEGETYFKCECCRYQVFGERHAYSAQPRQEQTK